MAEHKFTFNNAVIFKFEIKSQSQFFFQFSNLKNTKHECDTLNFDIIRYCKCETS